MPIAINGSGTLTGLSVRGLENGIITPAELSTGGPGWDAQSNLTNVASINAGPLAGMRNAIINGNFDIWQRGTSAVGNGFRADRFNAYLTAGTSFLQERYTLTDAQRNVIGYSARYALACFIGDTASSIQIQQPIEEVRNFAGQQVTVSFWAFVSSGTCTISGNLSQYFGTGGSPSSTVDTSLTLSATTVTTTPTKITATITLPSIGGKTLGSNGDDYIGLLIQRATGVATTLYIAQVQLEPGPVATPFERRPIGTELSLCQRYYETGSVSFCWNAGTPTDIKVTRAFVVTKRVVPTVSGTGVLGTFTSATGTVDRIQASFTATTNGNVAADFTASAEL